MALCALLCTAGCATESAVPASDVTEFDSAGVRVVEPLRFDVPRIILGDPAPLTDEAWVRLQADDLATAAPPGRQRQVRVMYEELPRPAHEPFWSVLIGAPEGEIWARRTPLRTDDSAAEWWVVSPGGRLAEVVTLPADASIQWLDAEVIVLRRNDEFGVERLHFYELGERRRKYLEGAPS